MNFINGDRTRQTISFGAAGHPLGVAPRICAEVPNPRGRLGTDLRGKCVRIGFIYLVVPVLGGDVITCTARPPPHPVQSPPTPRPPHVTREHSIEDSIR